MLESLSLAPAVNTAFEAKLLPNTSVELVKLAPICSISLRWPPKTVSLLFLSNSHLPEIPCLNLLSLKPYATKPSSLQRSFGPK